MEEGTSLLELECGNVDLMSWLFTTFDKETSLVTIIKLSGSVTSTHFHMHVLLDVLTSPLCVAGMQSCVV